VHDAAHATALGKCILGQLPQPARDDYLSRHPLHALTPRTVVDRHRLRLPGPGGVALDEGEYALGVCCLAAAVADGHEVGAVAVVSSPAEVHRPHAHETLLCAARRVSRALALGSGVA
jgi:DNA-binding IclR family transcriptional regulator